MGYEHIKKSHQGRIKTDFGFRNMCRCSQEAREPDTDSPKAPVHVGATEIVEAIFAAANQSMNARMYGDPHTVPRSWAESSELGEL